MNDRNPDNTDYFVRQLMNHRKRIYTFILTLVGNSSDADDIMQDTAALMWQKYHQTEEI
jgi:RNA polymerase sigma-70 factor (ECF subfamily)